MTDAVGWAASAAFLSSYFFRSPAALRRVQAGAALLWATYGILLGAKPIIVTNLLVAGVALWSSFRKGGGEEGPAGEAA